VKLVPNYNISEAKFTICNTIELLLHTDCQQTNNKTEDLYCFVLVLYRNLQSDVQSGTNWHKPVPAAAVLAAV